ncbi:hypothetical protein CERSUDRAFT_148314 [Gelatoporia subvermispora B]|uniref:Ras-GAP domain-containing protein n=1 Tax=Ceriporiopsis subvermispora (strain B) TaxID=914234 RepID=M2RNC1_CERS8|nr:hypothetical protein CERSUDRAFT_148314 [Gelatoporia subvermispora B]
MGVYLGVPRANAHALATQTASGGVCTESAWRRGADGWRAAPAAAERCDLCPRLSAHTASSAPAPFLLWAGLGLPRPRRQRPPPPPLPVLSAATDTPRRLPAFQAMPSRRASAGHSAAAPSSRVHRSNGSNHSVSAQSPLISQQSLPFSASSGLPSSPQQKVVQVLVNRLKNKLPCNSGITLTELEDDDAIQQAVESLVDLSRDSLDTIAWSLSELLDKLSKQIDSQGYRSIDVLQSQLFIMKVLSIAMASRWGRRPEDTRPSSRNGKQPAPSSKASTPDSATLPVSIKRRVKLSSDHLSAPAEPPPLDETCAKYILSVLVLYLRQTAPSAPRMMSSANLDFAASYHDFESVEAPDEHAATDVFSRGPTVPPSISAIPRAMNRARHASQASLNSGAPTNASGHAARHSLAYEKTSIVTSKSPLSLNTLIGKFAGRVVYHLSASNWQIVLTRIRQRIHFLAGASENDPDIVDLQLMAHSALDKTRLTQSLQELSSLLVNMKREAQAAVARPLRAAIWNWIDLFPEELNDVVRYHRRLDGAPERVFDILYDVHDMDKDMKEPPRDSKEIKSAVWPTLTALMCISSDRIKSELQGPQKHGRSKDRNFAELIIRSVAFKSKNRDVAAICALDVCRAASRIRPEEDAEIPLQALALDVAHELKIALTKWQNDRPVWDSPDEIDVAMVGDILVTLFRFLEEHESIPIFMTCLQPERSEAVKISAVKALITLIVEAPRLPWQPPLENLKAATMGRIAKIYRSCTLRRSELDEHGFGRKSALRPKAKRYTSETLPDRELLALSIDALWRADNWWFLHALDASFMQYWIPDTIEIWHSQLDPACKISMARTYRGVFRTIAKMPADHPHFDTVALWIKHSRPASLATVCTNLLDARTDLQAQRMWINMAYEFMFGYVQQYEEHLRAVQLNLDRVPAFALAEIAFLVALTSADSTVSLTAAHCLRLIAQAERMPNAPISSTLSEEERVKRYPIYEQLGDPKVTVVGRVGYQKRIRKLMRLMTFPSPVHIAVWEECYWRWCSLNEMVTRLSLDSTADGFEGGTTYIGENSMSADDRQAQWQNLTLFLSSFGSACIRETHDPSSLANMITSYYLPDQMRVLRDPRALLSSFLTDLINLLVSESIFPRDVGRDALGSEANPRLYTMILKQLDSVVTQLTDGDSIDWEGLALFLEQYILILKVIVENVQNLEELRGVDLASTLLTVAGLIRRFNIPESYKLKIKFCELCDSVFGRAETLIMRKDSSSRQRLVDVIVEWAQDPVTSQDREPLSPLQQLNVAVFRTAVRLFDKLKLEPAEGAAGEEATHANSRLFIKYSSFLMKAWEFTRSDSSALDDTTSEKSVSHLRVLQREGELRELLIVGLASLISTNTECGVKHTLPYAYEDDPVKRSIFAQVFTRVLAQGAKFSSQGTEPIISRQSRLCELVKGPDLILALTVCEICPASEVDNMIAVLLNIFDTRSSLMCLLKMMIDLEVSRTDVDTHLFRSNSTCTRFLSAFARIYGYNYLRSLIIPLVDTMSTLPEGRRYDLDPSKISEVELQQNKENVQLVASSFIQLITGSVPIFPPMFRELCAHIAKVVNQVWPEAKFTALGAFIFLRFISPAVVSPETIDIEVPKDPTLRRGLMLIAKIVQNLANNIFFGKEPHMVVLNDFLKENIVRVTRFLTEINKSPSETQEDEPEEWLDTSYDDTDTIVLHRFFHRHADKIGKELLSPPKLPSEKLTQEAEACITSGKRAWEALCTVLVDMGQPLESPKVSTATSAEHQDYLELMSRYKNKDTTSVQDLFVEVRLPEDEDDASVFILFANKVDVEILDIELLLYYIFKTLTSPRYETQSYDIIFDFTSFASTSQIPAQWLKFAQEVIPIDIRERFRTSRILTPNALALKYLRRMYNLASGAAFSRTYSAHCTVEELLEQYPDGTEMPPLQYAEDLEREPCEVFRDVTMRHTHPMRIPVTLNVAMSHLRITTTKAHQISNTLSCKATEIIPLADINDVYNVSTGKDSYEFIIRKVRHGVTSYFSSPARDAIVKLIRGAKGNMRAVHLPGAERFTRLSNVVTTLLHVGMVNVCSEDEEPRSAALELLSAVCTYLDYEGKPVVPSKSFFICGNSGPFLTQLSEGLATFAPQLTLDFVTEVASGISKAPGSQRVTCLQYMSPWLRNLGHFTDQADKLFDQSGARFRDCVRVLIDLTLSEHELTNLVHKYVWTEIGRQDSITVNAVLDECMRAAVDGGIGSPACDMIAHAMGALSSINVRGRIISRIRKVIGKTSMKPTKNLADNAHWNEIACLMQLLVVATSHAKSASHSQLYIPETFHLVVLTAATGQTSVRTCVYGTVVNMLQSLYSHRSTESSTGPDIQVLLEECSQPETLRLFGLVRPTSSGDYVSWDPTTDKLSIDTLESLTRFLARTMEAISGNRGLLNVWRARWMSLVTSSAFQLSPSIQTRAFSTLGILATSDVDDDLLYQMLVAFKTALAQSNENDTVAVVSMLRCMRNVTPALPKQSRYLSQLFWLAVALLQSSLLALYVEAINLLRVALETMDQQDMFNEKGMAAVLLEGREPLEEIACQLDQLLGLSFESSFSFSLASIIFKGVRHSGLKDATEATLRTLLRITVRACRDVEHADDGPGAPVCQEGLGYFLALLPMSTAAGSFKQLLEDADVDPGWLSEEVLAFEADDDEVSRIPFGLVGMADGHAILFVTSFISAMLVTAQGGDTESEILYSILSDVADAFPDIIALTYDTLQDRIKDIFANSSSPVILRAVSNIFRVAMHEADRAALARSSASTLSTVEEGAVHGPSRRHLHALEDQGMQGLANSFQFLPPNRGHATKMINWISELVTKIIE